MWELTEFDNYLIGMNLDDDEELEHSSSDSSEGPCLGSRDLVTPPALANPDETETTLFPAIIFPNNFNLPTYSTSEGSMSTSSNNESAGDSGHVKVIMTNEGGNSIPTSTTASSNQASGQQPFGTSILQSQLNAPPVHQQPPNSSTGHIQTVLSHFQGQGVGMEQPQQQMHPQMQQHHHHPMPQHRFSTQFQQHLMDSSQHSHSSPQMNFAQQLPPGSQFAVNHHHQHPHHQPQFMPYGINSSFANAGHHVGNLANPQLNPFHPHHVSNQQQSVGVINPMQHQPCLMNYQQQQPLSLGGARTCGVPPTPVSRWIGSSGHPATPMPMGSGPSNANGRGGRIRASQSSLPPKVKAVTPRVQVQKASPDVNSPPEGLEVLWRELHPECQNLMTQQDIPETARLRGYFTVCELIALKKTLENRMANSGKPLFASIVPVQSKMAQGGKVETKRGSKRGGQKGTAKAPKKTKYAENKEKKLVLQQLLEQKQDVTSTMQQDQQENGSNSTLLGILTNDLDNARPNEMQDLVTKDAEANESEVRGAMKAALEVLTSHSDQSMGNERETSDSTEDENLKNATNANESAEDENPDAQSAMDYEKMNCSGDQAEFAEVSGPTLPQFSGFGGNTQLENASSSSSGAIMKSGVTAASSSSIETLANAAHQILHNPIRHQRPQTENRHHGHPVQIQRTMTITLKLLEFGPYKIRSFVLSNPNKLKVLFNSQRMTYECQLPIMYSTTGDNSGPHPLRRTLTIDIAFDQITMLQFKSDSLTMQVEGLPLLQIATAIAQEREPELTLTEDDRMLLDQIDKGQLKLNPLHQLHFLNERQVGDLEFHCRGHPDLRKFIRA